MAGTMRTAWAIGFVIAGIAAAEAAAGPAFFTVKGVRPGHVLWIRAQGHQGAVRTGLIPSHGRRIQNLGCVGTPQTGWCHVRYRGTAGWAPARFLQPDKARLAALPEAVAGS